MDKITQALVTEFVASQELNNLSAAQQFEYFANFCACAQHYSDTFDVDLLSTGDFQGVDGIGVIVNGALVSSADEIEELIELNGYLDASFIFVQSKTTSGFDLGQMSIFADTVLGFFEDRPDLIAHADVQDHHSLKTCVFDHANRFRRNPQVYLYYVTTGRWDAPVSLEAHRAKAIDRFNEMNLFSDVSYQPVDAATVQTWYRRTRASRTADITFERNLALPPIPQVTEAFLGVLPATEFMKLLDDGSGGIIKAIFYENIRDYQRGSPVNVGISQTLIEGKGDEFVLRNNGVTIVAGAVSRVGNVFKITDYQIVNGCQTSHVLFENRDHFTAGTHIPIKLIITESEEVRSQIVISSNSQNKIAQEQLWALDRFQKNLEAFFPASNNDDEKLFYERRSRQYDTAANVEKVRIITPPDLVRSFASMFLGEPHKAGRYYKELTEYIPQGKLFSDTHKLVPYFASAYAAYRLAWLFRNKQMDTRFKLFLFHVVFALKTIMVGANHSALTSNAIEKEVNPLLAVLFNVDLAEALFGEIFGIVEASLAAQSLPFARDSARVQAFRDEVQLRSIKRRDQGIDQFLKA